MRKERTCPKCIAMDFNVTKFNKVLHKKLEELKLTCLFCLQSFSYKNYFDHLH